MRTCNDTAVVMLLWWSRLVPLTSFGAVCTLTLLDLYKPYKECHLWSTEMLLYIWFLVVGYFKNGEKMNSFEFSLLFLIPSLAFNFFSYSVYSQLKGRSLFLLSYFIRFHSCCVCIFVLDFFFVLFCKIIKCLMHTCSCGFIWINIAMLGFFDSWLWVSLRCYYRINSCFESYTYHVLILYLSCSIETVRMSDPWLHQTLHRPQLSTQTRQDPLRQRATCA